MVICGNGYYTRVIDVDVRTKYLVQKKSLLRASLLDIVKLISKLVLLIYMHKYDLFFIVYLLQLLDYKNFKFGVVRGAIIVVLDYSFYLIVYVY